MSVISLFFLDNNKVPWYPSPTQESGAVFLRVGNRFTTLVFLSVEKESTHLWISCFCVVPEEKWFLYFKG